jgi:hypothetical protein
MPAEAVAVHGFSFEFLADKPLFGDVADEFQPSSAMRCSWRQTRHCAAHTGAGAAQTSRRT